MEIHVGRTVLVLLLIFARLTSAEKIRVSATDSVCSTVSAVDSILRSRDSCLVSHSPSESGGSGGGSIEVREGDEVSLQRALNLVHKNRHEYVSVLFYASWCPFSKTCRPNFAILSALFPSIRHLAIEEAAIRPSILSSDVTGMKPASLNLTSLEKIRNPSNLSKLEDMEQENCPFSWARSPEKLLRQETYLALATTFVLLRLLYFLLPVLVSSVRRIWRRHTNLLSLWEHPQAYFEQAMQVFCRLKQVPWKRRNLQEGAMNTKAWAFSKSLASVSIGDSSPSRIVGSRSER